MLCAENISKAYGVPVLADINLTANRGRILGIAGANGSGKSTLISILAALRQPDRGRVTVDGEDLYTNRRLLKTKIGYVPQDISLFDNLSALDNIKFWAAAYGADYRRVPFDQASIKKKVKHLSGGMQKRLSIAVSVPHDPDFILMDEPTAALDIAFKRELGGQLADWRARGKAVILTSHQPDELMLCDDLAVLRDGGFVYEGSTAGFCADTNEAFQEKLFRLLV